MLSIFLFIKTEEHLREQNADDCRPQLEKSLSKAGVGKPWPGDHMRPITIFNPASLT